MKIHPAGAGLVIAERDMAASAVSVHGLGNLGAKPRAEGIGDILQSIAQQRA